MVIASFTALLVALNISVIPANAGVIIEGNNPSLQWIYSYVHTTCDGLVFTTVQHKDASNNYQLIFNKLSNPVIKVQYFDQQMTLLVDHPGKPDEGTLGCGPGGSKVDHDVEVHAIGSTSRGADMVHASWVIGGCPVDNIVDGCYKYEQRYGFYDTSSTQDAQVKLIIRIYGPGFTFTSMGIPEYHPYFRVDSSVPSSSTTDKFQRDDGVTPWATIQKETKTPLAELDDTGAQWRTCDKDTACSVRKLNIDPPNNDNPSVYVLAFANGQEDPTFDQEAQKRNEPSQWVETDIFGNPTVSVNGADIVFWYKTNRMVPADKSTCVPTSFCSVGPTIILKGSL